ncbi:MAG: DJ-1/PfpI family protein [Oscillospiraceae bacterium]
MVYAFFANGFEEIEAITPVDLLRRCSINVSTVGINDAIVKGSHKIPIFCDIEDSEMVLTENLEMIILPGGMPGILNLEASQYVQQAIDYCVKNNIKIAAICSAPSILGHKGILNGKDAVCFEGFENQLIGANVKTDAVCVDGNIITSRGAGTALEFSLKLVELLVSKERSDILRASLLCPEK